ncbi:MAG: zinc ribbon domain-containing protein, partial [Chloroflexota bacterium]
PRYTSQTCPACGCVDKRNRPTQAKFRCISCGLAGSADAFAARVIAARARAVVMQPNVGGTPGKVPDTASAVAPGTSCLL